MTERELIESAREGDEDAFGRLVDPHRGGLLAHCYRMLGSPQDAEDALQETLLRAWRGLQGFEGRSSPRSWLYTIATNASLRAIERRPPRVMPLDYGPASDPHEAPAGRLSEPVWVEPLADERLAPADAGSLTPEARYEQLESIELAFVAALQTLPARQRAVLVLREVLGFSARETGVALSISAPAVDSALQRARKTIEAHLPERSQQATLRALGDKRVAEIVNGYMAAWEQGDAAALAELLADDATISMPPQPSWYSGRAAVEQFVASHPMAAGRRWPCVQVAANGQLAFAHYAVDPVDGSIAGPHDICVVELAGERIASITAFLMPHLFPHFGLGERLQT